MPPRKKRPKISAKKDEQMRTAFDMARKGIGFDKIAAEMGIEEQDARDLVVEAIQTVNNKSQHNNLKLDIFRINVMIESLYKKAADGDPRAIEQINDLMDRRTIAELRMARHNPDFFKAIKQRNERGRPLHEPTVETRAMVQALALNGVTHDRIAHHLGVTPPTLTKHYAEELDSPKDKLVAQAAKNLWDGVRQNDKSYTIFALKTRGGYRDGSDRFGDQTSDAYSRMDDVDLKKELERMAREIGMRMGEDG